MNSTYVVFVHPFTEPRHSKIIHASFVIPLSIIRSTSEARASEASVTSYNTRY